MNQPKLLAYHGDPAIKQIYVNQVKAHQERDEITQGWWWFMGCGCLVGAALHSEAFWTFPEVLGLPEELARMGSGIFEKLEIEEAKLFPLEFYSVIPVGADCSRVADAFRRQQQNGESTPTMDKNRLLRLLSEAPIVKVSGK